MQNKSGYNPTEYKVLIKRKEVEEKSSGGIILPPSTQDKEKFATMEGTIIAVSHLSFTYATKEEWAGGDKPKAGDSVLVAKFAGIDVTGEDDVVYTLVNDKDIMAFIKED